MSDSILGYGPVKSIQWSPPIILVGESNPYGNDPRYALFDLPERAAGYRLRTLIFGVRRTTYARFHRVNLCDGEWNLKEAQERVATVRADLPSATFVLLGEKVKQAFKFSYMMPFVASSEGGQRFIFLPHPSGRNREWNRVGAFERARVLLQTARPDVPWGEELP